MGEKCPYCKREVRSPAEHYQWSRPCKKKHRDYLRSLGYVQCPACGEMLRPGVCHVHTA